MKVAQKFLSDYDDNGNKHTAMVIYTSDKENNLYPQRLIMSTYGKYNINLKDIYFLPLRKLSYDEFKYITENLINEVSTDYIE